MRDGGSPAASTQGPAEPFPIGHVHWTLPPTVGGVETYLAEVSRLTAARGFPVTVFTGQGKLPDWPLVETVPLDLLNLDRYADRWAGVRDDILAEELAEQLREEFLRRGIRVVHGHNLHHFTPVPALALNLLHGKDSIRLHHTYHSIWDSNVEQVELCRPWEGQHAFSKHIRDACLENFEVNPICTHPGIAYDRYESISPIAGGGREQVVLLPARLCREKGAELAIKMLARLRHDGLSVRLVLTSPPDTVDWDRESDSFKKEVELLIESLKMGPYVEFKSAAFDEMATLYAQADVVIYPSIYREPLGLAPLEAAAAGRPVVVSSGGGLPETVENNVTGFVVPADDCDALVHRVRSLLENADLARRMGQAGREYVQDQFSLDNHVESMIGYYRRSLAIRPTSGDHPLAVVPQKLLEAIRKPNAG
jgi:glycosyltransferase involved in cell wall biosynthesis